MPSSSMPRGQDDSERVSRPVPSLHFLLVLRARLSTNMCVSGACVSLLPVHNQSNFNMYITKVYFAHLRIFGFSTNIATL